MERLYDQVCVYEVKPEDRANVRNILNSNRQHRDDLAAKDTCFISELHLSQKCPCLHPHICYVCLWNRWKDILDFWAQTCRFFPVFNTDHSAVQKCTFCLKHLQASQVWPDVDLSSKSTNWRLEETEESGHIFIDRNTSTSSKDSRN